MSQREREREREKERGSERESHGCLHKEKEVKRVRKKNTPGHVI
jgi:hypothetical protein